MRRALNLAFALAISSLLFPPNVLCQNTQREWYHPTGPPAMMAKAAAYYQKALQAYENGDDNATIGLCKAATQYSHGDKNIVHLTALAYARSGDNYNAMEQFRAALQLDYNFIPCRNNYGLFLKKTGKVADARQMFEECIKINPRYPDAYYHLGEILKENGDLDGAIDNFQTATRLNPSYVDAQKDLGLAIYERYSAGQGGDMATSVEKLEIAAKLMPDNPIIHYHLGNIYCADGRLDDAEADFRKALRCDARCAPAHFELGRLRYLRGDPNRCLDELKQAASINPLYTDDKKWPRVDTLAVKSYMAKAYEIEGRNLEAVECWKDVNAMLRNSPDTAKHIAELEHILRSGAKKKHGKGAAIDPEEINALTRKGLDQEDDGDLNGAKVTFQRALELNPESFDATQNLGYVLESTGDLNGALAKYQAALALAPKYDGLLYNMGYMLEKMNLPGDAGDMYERFHEMAGRYPYDPHHNVALMQTAARQRMKQEQIRKRGY